MSFLNASMSAMCIGSGCTLAMILQPWSLAIGLIFSISFFSSSAVKSTGTPSQLIIMLARPYFFRNVCAGRGYT